MNQSRNQDQGTKFEKFADREIPNKLMGVPIDLNTINVESYIPLVAGCWITCPLTPSVPYLFSVEEPDIVEQDKEVFKKLPGGRWNCRDHEAWVKSVLDVARLTVKREVYQETGLILPIERYVFVGSEIRPWGKWGPHEYFLFKAEATPEDAEQSFVRKGISRALNGEVPHFDPLQEVVDSRSFLPSHIKLLDAAGLWPEKTPYRQAAE